MRKNILKLTFLSLLASCSSTTEVSFIIDWFAVLKIAGLILLGAIICLVIMAILFSPRKDFFS
jgi:hypothetical protein